jgi:pimeloyl-ACP methyl ester carboxylesterase
MSDFAEVVAGLIGELGWRDVTLVGHSMGGAVAVEAAAIAPVQRVICLDSLTYAEYYPRQDEESIANVLATIAAAFPGTMDWLVERYSVDHSDRALMGWIAAEMGQNPVTQALGSWRSLLEWDRDERLKKVDVLISVIAAAAFLDDRKAALLASHVKIVPVRLGGHFFHREDPQGTASAVRAELTDNASDITTAARGEHS